MVSTMTEQAIQTATTAQPTPAQPVPRAAPAGQPVGARRVWRALGLVLIGALLAVGIMMALPMRQTIIASRQGEMKSVSEVPSPAPAVTQTDTSAVRIHTQQMQHIHLTTVDLKEFREEKSATGKIAFNEEC